MITRGGTIDDGLGALLLTAEQLYMLVREEHWTLADLAYAANVNERRVRKLLMKRTMNTVALSRRGRLILNTETDEVDYERR